MSDKHNKCQWDKCHEDSEIIYLGVGLCEKHWEKVCAMPREKAYEKLGIKSNSIEYKKEEKNENT